MFERILVPLDGSARAERAIPVAARLARATSGSILLLQVVDRATENEIYPVRMDIVTTQDVEANVTKATDYLNSLMKNNELEGIGIQIEVLIGDAAPTICSFAQSATADMIVMCSHGYTGLKRWLLGSVADVVARTAPTPILILRDEGPLPMNGIQDEVPVRVLVTLDGSPLSEAVIEPVIHLVAALAAPASGSVHFLRIVDFPLAYGQGKGHANFSLETIEHSKQIPGEYLISLMKQLEKGSASHLNLSLTASVISSNDVANSIIEAAESTSDNYALLALSTHGRSGWTRWVMGSVTQRVLHHTRLPIFIVRPQRDKTKQEAIHTQASTSTPGRQGEQSWVGLL